MCPVSMVAFVNVSFTMSSMADPIDLTRLLPEARAFLAELEANNDRGWFNARKARYDTELKRPAEKLMAEISPILAAETGQMPRKKLFRPHRDVRFSEDKTPYHTHLHMMWSLSDGRAWMLGIAPSYATAGIGIMQFENDQLDRYRTAVADDEGAALAEALEDGWRVDPPALKRIPTPYVADHPRADLLRHKGLVVWADDLEDALTRDPTAALAEVFARAAPVMAWLEQVA